MMQVHSAAGTSLLVTKIVVVDAVLPRETVM